MILALFEYGDIIYSGTSSDNLKKIDRLFYRGLRICTGTQMKYSEYEVCKECKTRLYMAPVFWYYKPNNEKAKLNVIYRGAREKNSMAAKTHNLEFAEFKTTETRNCRHLYLIYVYFLAELFNQIEYLYISLIISDKL